MIFITIISFRNSEIQDFSEYSKVKGSSKKNISFLGNFGNKQNILSMIKGYKIPFIDTPEKATF